MGASNRRLLPLAVASGIAACSADAALAQTQTLPELNVTATREIGTGSAIGTTGVYGVGITGASTTVITAQDIERSPGMTLQDLLAREPGIQVRNLFGQVNGAQTTVDMRGFGAAASSNTLVLVNGRRLNDVDMAGVDYSAIPKNSIERIEITRGNSGAVLYGDGAVGGVINIITKTGVELPASARVQGAFGSFKYLEGNVSANGSSGPWSASVHANGIRSDGYRENNELRQKNAVGDLRWNNGQGTGAYLTLSADDQHLGLPGGRRVTLTTSELVTNRRGAATPFDFGDKKGLNATLGVTHMLWSGTELIVDGGVRHKKQEAGFFSAFGVDFDTGVAADLTSLSLTPRISSIHQLGAMPGKLLAGVDIYDSRFDQDRGRRLGEPPIHRYDLRQTTIAAYFQETLGIRPDTDVAVGARVQRNLIEARDRISLTAPGCCVFGPPLQGLPLDDSETQYALHVGVEHRLAPDFALFARAARSFRLPNVDERVGMAPFGVPTNFNLKTQTSHDFEAGFRAGTGALVLQSSIYYMELKDELHFSPATFTNTNLDPTKRYGVENVLIWRATDTVRFKGGLAYTRAQFREGPFAGHEVPLVSPWTGSAGVSWDIYQKWLVLDAVARFFSKRRMDNDQANFQPQIPSEIIVDVRLGGEINQFFWAFSVQNVFDVQYFEYAVASAFAFGTYNAYPLPGRTYLLRAGMTF